MPVMVILRIVILLWLVICAVFDLRQREVPDGLTLPAVVVAVVWQVVHPGGWLPWALAGATVVLTLAGVLPGGDMKGWWPWRSLIRACTCWRGWCGSGIPALAALAP